MFRLGCRGAASQFPGDDICPRWGVWGVRRYTQHSRSDLIAVGHVLVAAGGDQRLVQLMIACEVERELPWPGGLCPRFPLPGGRVVG